MTPVVASIVATPGAELDQVPVPPASVHVVVEDEVPPGAQILVTPPVIADGVVLVTVTVAPGE